MSVPRGRVVGQPARPVFSGARGGGGSSAAASSSSVTARADVADAASTGRITLQNRGLTAFPDAVFESGAKSEQWWLVEAVRSIDLCGNAIASIPARLPELADSLTHLRLADNRIASLPPQLFECTALKQLELSRNGLTVLPPEVSLLTALVELGIAGNGLKSLPSLAGCAHLELLRASGNALTSLPPDLGVCAKLLELHVSNNALRALPDSLGECARLRTITASHNELTDVPLTLAACTQLQYMDLRQNKLTQAPQLPVFEQAAEVFLGSNQLRELSAARIVRSKLTVLDVSDNRLSALPDDCRLLHALHTLDLRNNDFALLPAWLGFLPVLTRLAVDGNPMRSMRRVVAADSVPSLKAFLKSRASAQETALWEAELAGIALPLPAVAPGSSSTTLSGTVPGNSGGVSSAPALTAAGDVALAVEAEAAVAACWTVVLREGVASGRVNAPSSAFPAPLRSVTLEALAGGRLGMLPRIQALCLDGQAMTSVDALPRDLFMHCPSLHELSMRGIRRLTALPHAVACHADLPLSQQHLRVLLLSDCALTPAALELLPASVSELDVSGNQLRRLPPVLPHLPLLTHLNLARNELRIPDAESEEDDNLWCPRLQVLDLRENALTRLPTSVMALPSLLQLDISYNNLSIIPPHLGMLSTLTALNIEGNPQRSIRAAITDRGAAAVIAYLRSRIPAGDENRFLVMYRDDMEAEEGGEGVDVARMATHFGQLAPFGALPTAVAAPSVYPPAHAATGSGAMLTTPHAAAGGTARSSGPPATAEHYLRMHSQPNLPQREVHSAVAGGEWPPSAPCAASFASVRRGGGAYDCMPPPLPALLPSSAPPMSALAACRADIAALQAEVDGGVGTAPHLAMLRRKLLVAKAREAKLLAGEAV